MDWDKVELAIVRAAVMACCDFKVLMAPLSLGYMSRGNVAEPVEAGGSAAAVPAEGKCAAV